MYYQIEKMDNYYRIGGPEGVFSYVVVGNRRAMLIDTGYGFGNLKEAVRGVTDKPLYIVNTHGHCDHVGGNGQFEEPVFIHKKDMGLCREHTTGKLRKDSAMRAEHSVNYETGEEYNGLPEGFDMEAYCGLSSGNLQEIKEGDTFDLGGATLKIIETPGHTLGGISILYVEKNILFIGDAAGHFVWLFAKETTSRREYINTLQKLYGLSADAYIGGHNPLPMRKEDFPLYIKAAEEADYETGIPFESFLDGEENPRVCALGHMTMEEMFQPGFAAVVISKNK